MAGKPLILLSNDDGVHAPGLRILAECLSDVGEILVVAPHVEQSATSQSITIKVPLRCERISERVYGVEGTPADCILFAVRQILDRPPNFIISGINRGANLGTDTLYSGTVGAALEGALQGISSIAVSSCGSHTSHHHYESAGAIAKYILENHERFLIEDPALINVNVPNLPIHEIRGIRAAILGKRVYEPKFIEGTDPRGSKYYWTGASTESYVDIPGSDCELIHQRFATVTALRASLFCEDTHRKLAANLSGPLPPISQSGAI